MNYNFNSIPEELKAYPSWCVWKYEEIGAAKPTKIPYSAHDGTMLSINNVHARSTFEQAVKAFETGNYSGIGFVLSEDDPFFVIDLDNTDGDKEAIERQQKIFKEFDTYSEISPSGQGLHLIGKGSVAAGRRRSFVEIYSSQRYITFTGNVYYNAPIAHRQDMLSQLWEQMAQGGNSTYIYRGDAKETCSDEEVISRAITAVNGEKFAKLNSGQWQDLYPSQSEADLAYVNIIAFYTQNRNQIIRIFRTSPLGKRLKAQRVDYINWMILKSFDKILPQLDFDGFKNAIEARIAEQPKLDLENENEARRLSNIQWRDSSSQGKEDLSNQSGSIENTYEIISKEMEKITQERNNFAIEKRQQQEIWEKTKLDAGIQSQFEMHILPGNPSGLSGFSPQRPKTKITESFSNDTLQQGENIKRNSEMRSNLQQLPSQVTLSGENKRHPIIIPNGLLGEIAQFIYSAAPRPVPEIAIAGAIGLMAGICGRAYNVSNTGLNQYILLLAKTGAGKEGMAAGIDKIMNAIKVQVPTANEFIGPSHIASGQALVKYVHKKSQCFVSIIGEFGITLRNMSSQTASNHERMLKQILLELYNKSGHTDIYRPSISADLEKNTEATASPAFSLLCESVPSSFYETLDEEMIREGLLPRFMIIEYDGKRVHQNKHHATTMPQSWLIDKFVTLTSNSKQLMHNGRVITVTLSDDALKVADEFDVYATNKINATDDEVVLNLWNRAHLKALKLAALVAVGVNMFTPTITLADLQWAMQMVEDDIKSLSLKFESGKTGSKSSENNQRDEIIRIIKKYIHSDWEKQLRGYGVVKILHDNRVIPYSYLSKILLNNGSFKNDRKGSTLALKQTIQMMLDSDDLREIGKADLAARFGTTQRAFVISNLKILD